MNCLLSAYSSSCFACNEHNGEAWHNPSMHKTRWDSYIAGLVWQPARLYGFVQPCTKNLESQFWSDTFLAQFDHEKRSKSSSNWIGTRWLKIFIRPLPFTAVGLLVLIVSWSPMLFSSLRKVSQIIAPVTDMLIPAMSEVPQNNIWRGRNFCKSSWQDWQNWYIYL